MGVPGKLGGGGMEGVIELDLSPSERSALNASVESVKELVAQVDNLLS